jgi:ketosteroid isomerase-like protein
MARLADAWSCLDTEAALDCFTDDAIYMQPPDQQFYQGRVQLRPYFEALSPGTLMRFHHLWFDAQDQSGAGEFTFGLAGEALAEHGLAVVELQNGRIAFWREYLQKGPANFQTFLALQGKTWRWHIGNYP